MMLWVLVFCRVCISIGSPDAALLVCFFKQRTAYEVGISDWRADVCVSDLALAQAAARAPAAARRFRAAGRPRRLGGAARRFAGHEIGRASCRDRVCQYG